MKRVTRILAVSITIVSMVGCAANGSGVASSGEGEECSALKTGAAGMLVGAALGAAINGKKGAAQGAVLGGAVGALGCMSMNYKAKKVRDAQMVNEEYMERNRSLPPEPMVTAYSLQAPRQAPRGKPVNVTSDITIVDGSDQPVNQVEEKLFIVNAENKRKQIKSKEAQNSGMNTGGEYSNSFSFTPPEGVAQGNYRLESEVYVNNRLAKTASAPVVIAYNNSGVLQLAFLE